ncbi:hypothetical protein GS399_18165 [Pedobacter sp. HMF7647]|uniref:DUF3108 domain-containing protein n=1 Tax=Hufsiella arboris TaxID=2695275 RepID=A0A7K1YE66_9SPHI|nr:hypothetical protein [Hufsiella arboris]MXV52903.1 hypothetical protein [Hufsiella arboris]
MNVFKINNKQRHQRRLFYAGLFAALLLSIASCKKTDDSPGDNGGNGDDAEASFIPESGRKYQYAVEMEDGSKGTETRWITGAKDSAGLRVYNLRTHLVYDDEQMDFNNGMYTADGKTFTRLVLPEKWNEVIDIFKAMEGVTVLEAAPIGFPVSQVMENAVKQGSKLTFAGPETQGMYLKYELKSSDTDVDLYEMTQSIKQHPGTVTKVETITVPAGTFTCSKFESGNDISSSTKINGNNVGGFDIHESLEVWVAHGVGVVKSISSTSTGMSTTVLQKIE